MAGLNDYAHETYIGRALIINNEVDSNNTYSAETIKDRLNKLGFHGVQKGETQVSVYRKINKTLLLETLKKATENDWNEYTCFVCVILGYGEEGVIFCPEDGSNLSQCSLDDLQKPFKCENLMHKPKLFLLHVTTETSLDTLEQPEKNANTKIPTDSDLLVHWCQDTETSQDYIKTLTEAIDKHCKKKDGMDVLRILTVINHKMHQKDNVPLVTSTLRKRLFLYSHDTGY